MVEAVKVVTPKRVDCMMKKDNEILNYLLKSMIEVDAVV